MIAVDTSALIAVLLGEPLAAACGRSLAGEIAMVMSSATLTEALIVSRGREVEAELIDLLSDLPIEIVPVSSETSWRINEIHRRWGKGHHPARLNIMDCYAYDIAAQYSCPLLFIGNDFSQTDIISALA